MYPSARVCLCLYSVLGLEGSNGDLAVPVSTEGALVDVGASHQDVLVVKQGHLAVHVDRVAAGAEDCTHVWEVALEQNNIQL